MPCSTSKFAPRTRGDCSMRIVLVGAVLCMAICGCDKDCCETQCEQPKQSNDKASSRTVIDNDPVLEGKSRIAIIDMDRVLASYNGTTQIHAEIQERFARADAAQGTRSTSEAGAAEL